MASLTIRNLDEDTERRLKRQAAHNNRSMEEEARLLLRGALEPEPDPDGGLASAIRRIVDPIGGIELEIPARIVERDPPDFSGPEYDR